MRMLVVLFGKTIHAKEQLIDTRSMRFRRTSLERKTSACRSGKHSNEAGLAAFFPWIIICFLHKSCRRWIAEKGETPIEGGVVER